MQQIPCLLNYTLRASRTVWKTAEADTTFSSLQHFLSLNWRVNPAASAGKVFLEKHCFQKERGFPETKFSDFYSVQESSYPKEPTEFSIDK